MPIPVIIAIILAVIITPFIMVRNKERELVRRIEREFGSKPDFTDYELASIKSYYEYVCSYTDTEAFVDSITWNDLDMDEVFKRINATHTSVGEEYLYNALHEIRFDTRKLLQREQLIDMLDGDDALRKAVQLVLLKLGKSDFNQLCGCIFDAKSKALDNGWIYNLMAFAPFVFAALIFIAPTLGIVLTVLSVVANGLIYLWLKLTLDKEIAAIRYFKNMLYACRELLKLDDAFVNKIGDIERNYTFFKDLKSQISTPAQQSMSPIGFLADYYKMLFLVDIRKYNRTMKRIVDESEAFHALYRSFGELDVALSVLSFRKSLDFFCEPEFHDTHKVEFTELYHPLLDEPVTNDGVIARHSLVTGPNASGKSTFIKAIAINSILAQTIHTCTARKYKLTHSLVMTSMAVRDSIMEGDSYFITEIKSLKRVLDTIERMPCTCFIDEILRGTNTIERIAASTAILKYLVGRECLCMAASHDIELTRIMEGLYDNYHFSETVKSEGVTFDFKLKEGAANTRNAIRLLGFLGYEPSVVDEANENVENFIKTGTWMRK